MTTPNTTPRHSYEYDGELLYGETLSSIREWGSTPETVLNFFRTRGRSRQVRTW